MRFLPTILAYGFGTVLWSSSLAVAKCPPSFSRPVLNDLVEPEDPDLDSIYAVMAARVGSLESLDVVFTSECLIRFTNGLSWQTALNENDTWHEALAHVISMTLDKEERLVANISRLLSPAKLELWSVESAYNSSVGVIKDAEDLNSRLGPARADGILLQYSDPDSLMTVVDWDVSSKNGVVSEWRAPQDGPADQRINKTAVIGTLWDDKHKPTGVWIPAQGKPYFGPGHALAT